MKLEQQVSSLELSKRLKDLGVKQESLFYWNLWHGQMDDFMYQVWYGKPVKRGDGVLSEDTCSAFTVAELGNMLGATDCLQKAYNHVFNVSKSRAITELGLQMCMTNPDIGSVMLIYLLENKLITV